MKNGQIVENSILWLKTIAIACKIHSVMLVVEDRQGQVA